MYCTNCGKELVEGANFCNACGSKAKAARRMASAEEAPAEETGGVRAALSSGRSRSRLRMPPLILLVLVLALTAGIAAAVVYVYSQTQSPSSVQEEPTGTGEPYVSSSTAPESASYHFANGLYEFDLPEYWRDRVVVIQDRFKTSIYAKASYDAGYNLRSLADIDIYPYLGGPYGDVSWGVIFDEEILPRVIIKVGASTPAIALASVRVTDSATSADAEPLTIEELAEYVFPGVPQDILSDYIDLSSGGALSLEDLDNVDFQFVSDNDCYARAALPPLITLNKAPSPDAIAAYLLDGWFSSVGGASRTYLHIENGVEYTYRPSDGAGSMAGYQLASSRQLVSIERIEGAGDGSDAGGCWVFEFDDGGMYWIYDEPQQRYGVELYDHERTSLDELPAYSKHDKIDDSFERLAEASEDRSG